MPPVLGRTHGHHSRHNCRHSLVMLHHDQSVSEMANEILSRQARARAEQSGESFEEALDAVLKTEAGKKLWNLNQGSHRNERAKDWQESLVWERAKERSGG